ncbi:MAG TPA: pilin [Candidatus Gracilibacteria bacterium]|nr:pilin [Candidatus Gracilibacteria bacterium]
MSRLKSLLFLSFFLCGVLPGVASAQTFTILPATELEGEDCATVLNQYEVDGKIPTVAQTTNNSSEAASQNYYSGIDPAADVDCGSSDPVNPEGCAEYKQKQESAKKAKDDAEKNAEANKDNKSPDAKARDDLLGCAIKTGRVSLQMLPYFITYIGNFLLAMVGIICVLFIVIGGYQYIYGGLIDQKEKGKKTIIHALMGMSVALLAWVIVSVIISAITS